MDLADEDKFDFDPIDVTKTLAWRHLAFVACGPLMVCFGMQGKLSSQKF
jgi:hypothetical protein